MVEPIMTPEAAAKIEAYTGKMARKSTLSFARAEDARRELGSHIEDLAREIARASGSAEIRVVHALDAIRSVGDDDAVAQAFFHETRETERYNRLKAVVADWWRTIVLGLLVAYPVLHAFGMFYDEYATRISTTQVQILLALLLTTVGGAIGLALRKAWVAILVGTAVFVSAVLLAPGTTEPWIWWTMPAIALVVGGIFVLAFFRSRKMWDATKAVGAPGR